MKSYVIYLPKSELSTKSANNVIDVAKKVGNVEVELWEGVDKFHPFILTGQSMRDNEVVNLLSGKS